jgi:predicted nucleic acid-binding protein
LIVLDTSGLLAAVDSGQRRHVDCREALERDSGPLLLSPFVLAELDYLVTEKYGVTFESSLLREVARGVYDLQPFSGEDVDLATDIIERYADMRIGLADASLVVIAAAAGTNRILTLDERHFRAMQPLSGESFEILPADR